MKTHLTRLAVAALLGFFILGLVRQVRANEQPARIAQPKLALGIDSPDVTKYGIRIRASARVFDKAKYSVRDLLGTFSEPASTRFSNFESPPGGFNAILDPGYDMDTASAGGVRTTPLQMMWSWRDDACAGDDAACLALDKNTSKRFHWLQVRSPDPKCNKDDRVIVPDTACDNSGAAGNGGQDWYGMAVAGGVLCNQRGVPPYWQANQREHGFYVSSEGNCFVEQNVCMSNKGLQTRPDGANPGGWCMDDTCTAHQQNELGVVCDMDPQWAPPANEIYMNVGVFIFPNGMVESAGAGALFSPAVPAWARPRTLHYSADGDYFGYVPVKRYGTYTGRDASLHPLRQSAADGAFRWYASGFPTQGTYDEANAYSEYFGSYFRQGDDIAFYADVKQMQIHSIDRDAVSVAAHGTDAVAGCGQAPVYTGQLDGNNKPIYFLDRVPQCLRPKSYWHGPPNVPAAQAKKKWVACNAYDTYLNDGVTLNPNRDDNYVIYPGNDSTKKCGAQVAGQIFSPFDSGGQGTGWSALKIDTFALDTANNEVDFALSGTDWRLELAMFWAFATECIVEVSYTSPACGSKPGYQLKRKWNTGAMMIQSVNIAGSAKLFSIDNNSCTAANGECADPWGPANDNMVRPDRIYIGLNLPTLNIAMYPDPAKNNWGGGWGTQRNSYRAVYGDLSGWGRSCFALVYDECAFSFARFDDPDVDGTNAAPELILPQITDALASEFNTQFRELIEGTVDDLNAEIPSLSTVLGDPWNFGNSLVDVGIFLTGSAADGILDPSQTPTPSRKIWPIPFKAPPAGRSAVIDINAALGFRPIAFELPIPPNNILKVDDPSNGINANSFYAVPTMVYPDTSTCQLEIKGANATSVSAAGAAANTWSQTGTSFTYDNATGWLTNLGTLNPGGISGYNFGRAFFNRTNWKWGVIRDVHKDQLMNPINAYRIEGNRGNAPGDGSFSATAAWGISDGWIQIAAPTAPRTFADIRVGDTFYFDEQPTAKFTIIALGNSTNRAIRLDFAASRQNVNIPFRMDGARPYTIVSRSCSRGASLYPNVITDGYDYGDYALDRAFTDSKTGKAYTGRDVIQPYFMNDASLQTAPAWCMSPQRARQEADALATRFPMKTWLMFDAADVAPAGFDTSQSLPSPTTYTLGKWDYIPRTYLGPAPAERLTMSDVAINAGATSPGAWVSTTANVSNSNANRALRSTNKEDTFTGTFTTNAPGEEFNVWVAHSRVVAAVPAEPAKEQITRSDGVINGIATSKGGWVPTTQYVVNSNQALALRAGNLSDSLTFPVNTVAATATYNVWVAHSRTKLDPVAIPESEQITRSDHVLWNGTATRGNWVRSTTNMGAANNSTSAGGMRSGASPSTLTYSFTTQMASATYTIWVANSRVHNQNCGGLFQPGCQNPTLAVQIDATQVGGTIAMSGADNTWVWTNVGTRALTAGNHTVSFVCTGGNNTKNCGVDGVVITSTTTNPATAGGFTPYATANWDAAANSWYQPFDNGVRPPANTTLSLSIDGTQVGANISQTVDDSWVWTNLGTRALTAGPHNITINCTSANNNRCALDGVVLTTETTNPSTATGFIPYATADWDAAALNFYFPPTGTPTNSYLSMYIDGQLMGYPITQTADNTWAWLRLGKATLLQGAHTLTFTCSATSDRRCGVDGILITTDGTNPASAAGYTPYTTANWDAGALDFYTPSPPGTPVRGVVRSAQNDYSVKEPGPINYDASLHIHQRTLNQLAQAVVSSGSTCIEFGANDPETGEETPWADFMTTERFAAFIPELTHMYKNAPVKLRISPLSAPRVRMGVGALNYTPGGGGLVTGSAPIANEPYTVAAAFPDLQLSFVVVDPQTNTDITVLKLNWNAVVGVYLRAMRQCHQLDPLAGSAECTSLDPFIRTISGYWQLYLDYGNPTLSANFEAPTNALDGFQQGRFTRSEFVCPECTPAVPAGQAKFEVVESYCGANCDMLGLAQAVTMLLDSAISLYADTRVSTTFLQIPLNIDVLYIGPDGPNDDGLGVSEAGSRGDYLGLYARLFGADLDLMGMIDGITAALGAPAMPMIPKATVFDLEQSKYVTTNSPQFDVAMLGEPAGPGESVLYTYRLDGGFWRTPRSEPRIELASLTEGSHRLELRSIVETADGSVNQLQPTMLQFVVDSLPPELSIPPSRKGGYKSTVPIEVHDWQTPAEDIQLAYSMDDGEWQELDEPEVSLRRFAKGRHTLRVKATDYAGNTATAAREIVIDEGSGCGCHSTDSGDALGTLAVFLLFLGAHAWMRRMRRA